MEGLKFVFIIIGIIIWIVKQVNKSKAKQGTPKPPVTPKKVKPISTPKSETEIDIDTLLKNILEKEKNPPKPEPVAEPIVLEKPKVAEARKPKKEKTKNTRGHSHAHSVENEEEFDRFDPYEIKKQADREIIDKLRNPDGAREAFIMSEIFQKKY